MKEAPKPGQLGLWGSGGFWLLESSFELLHLMLPLHATMIFAVNMFDLHCFLLLMVSVIDIAIVGCDCGWS